MTDSSAALPSRARVVIIGGGVIGSSVAYHLAKAGWTDVVLLERDRLTSGTTWHAAGLMTCFGSFSETSMAMRLYTRQLYSELEAETGLSTGFKAVGFIEAAADEGRLEEYRRVAAFNRMCGLDVQEISPTRDQRALPDRRHHRPARRLLCPRRRTGQPGRRHDVAGQGRPDARRADHRGDRGDRRARRRRSGRRGDHRAGRDRVRVRRQLRRHVGHDSSASRTA